VLSCEIVQALFDRAHLEDERWSEDPVLLFRLLGLWRWDLTLQNESARARSSPRAEAIA
jgi:hypothetical protein